MQRLQDSFNKERDGKGQIIPYLQSLTLIAHHWSVLLFETVNHEYFTYYQNTSEVSLWGPIRWIFLLDEMKLNKS